MQRNSQPLETRRAFGLLFIGVSVAVVIGAVLSEVAAKYNAPVYEFVIIWLVSFGATFGAIFRKFRRVIFSVRARMKNSFKWPIGAKVVNGLCWAAPFASIGMFPSMYQYLILVGIGLGNFSTYLLMKKYSHLENREQMIVGLISLASIPISIGIGMTLFALRHDLAVFLSRMLIAIAYAAGGIYAVTVKKI
ncbi:MAG: hypothetical protein WAM14_10080 [Candidatus Nitrosopolaris sp.]